ncbi:sigma-54 interaction domain-containing protein [Celerinatantimonas yamalensis]|uniref:Sigma-54 dependent transcriptional regulator n=1 Tax=Celerinatantimonas yamalensis TaxID=559956 RepID=A0ABW9G7V6_9GAMM
MVVSCNDSFEGFADMLEGYDCPALLVSLDYQILAINQSYTAQFGEVFLHNRPHCFEISHGASVPCDQVGESCPLLTSLHSGRKERALHVHQTPHGQVHVDVQIVPIHNLQGQLRFFVELLRAIPVANTMSNAQALVGSSHAFNHMLEQIVRVSHSDASVLLLGESGTGKELVAHTIHKSSSRANHSLVTLECAGLTDSLFESELFGHVKGAFTGANSNRTGLVELAHEGTLFLDEIGDVPLSMQVKLLRLIETGSFRAVGCSTIKHTNFRLICATHKNIEQMVKAGEFRQDLYYRINVFPIYLPPLRERVDDLHLLIKTLLQRIDQQKEYHLTDEALNALKRYTFPGNIRELSNILNRAVILTDTNLIEQHTIEKCIHINQRPNWPIATDFAQSNAMTIDGNWVDLKTAQARYLSNLMNFYHHDKEHVAKVAGISLRSLYRKLNGLTAKIE